MAKLTCRCHQVNPIGNHGGSNGVPKCVRMNVRELVFL